MPELFKQPEQKIPIQKVTPGESEKSNIRYIFIDKLEKLITKSCANLSNETGREVWEALHNWFDNNGVSYAHVTKKGRTEQFTFFYAFSIEKLRNDLKTNSSVPKNEISKFISELSLICKKNMPEGADQRTLEEDMPFMQKKDDGLRNV